MLREENFMNTEDKVKSVISDIKRDRKIYENEMKNFSNFSN